MSERLYNPVTDKDHSQGADEAPLELVEYGDYQCPSCGEAYFVLKKVQQQLGKYIKFVFRNFPLEEHPDAFAAAMAAEAASNQHKFWEMHDMMYSNQLYLGSDNLLDYAEELGLDMQRFSSDLQSKMLASKIQADFEGGERSGVTGTPNFYINDEKYEGDWESEALIYHLKGLL